MLISKKKKRLNEQICNSIISSIKIVYLKSGGGHTEKQKEESNNLKF